MIDYKCCDICYCDVNLWWNNLINYFLEDFCAYVTQNAPKEKHVIAANEGNAVAIATGYHLATGKHPMVYLQVIPMFNLQYWNQ